MESSAEKKKIARRLQAEIDALQGLGKSRTSEPDAGLFPFAAAFPGSVFPNSGLHEFISYEPGSAAATTGFLTAMASRFIKEGCLCLWIGNRKQVFPPGLTQFGVEPRQVIFIDTPKVKDNLWIIEEALKCEALSAVVAEIRELGFTESRRLQLAVERSGITGFIHRYMPFTENAIACTTRWKITPLPSIVQNGLPGVGHSSWDVQLWKVRNGKPGAWRVSWSGNKFVQISDPSETFALDTQKHAV